jgi:hypothetical protein
MRKFTVKDFIAYNNPCFSCNSQINFRIGFLDLETKADISYLRPAVTPTYTEVDLIIKYANTDALKLYIFHKTNKILTNSQQGLTKYLSSRKLFLSSTCDKCYTQIESQYLDFNLDKGFVSAVGISSERLMVSDGDNLYQINSFFMAEKSNLIVDKLDKVRPLSPFQLDLPLIPKYRFKDKAHFIHKMKTYITFS